MKRKLILEKKEDLSKYANRGALFLDRDGVIIEDKHHLQNPDLVELCPGASEIIRETRNQGNSVIIVTNQSGISRGIFTWEEYNKVTNKILSLLGEHAMPTAIYANGFGPIDQHESWRKPNPGMLLEASKDLALDLRKSTIVGDRLSDVQAGVSAKVAKAFHLLTGKGRKERKLVEKMAAKMNPNEYETQILMSRDLNEITEIARETLN